MKQNPGGRRFKDGGVEALRETVGGDAGHGLISCSVINAGVVVVVVVVTVWEGGDTVRLCLDCYYWSLNFKRRSKSHLPLEGIIRSSPYSPRFQDKD